MTDYFMGNGFNYLDTAYAYHKGNGGHAAKLAIVDRYPREDFKPAEKPPVFLLVSKRDNRKYFRI